MQIEWIFQHCFALTCDSLIFKFQANQRIYDERGENSSSRGNSNFSFSAHIGL